MSQLFLTVISWLMFLSLAETNCMDPKEQHHRRFFNMDLHISVIADVKSQLLAIDPTIEIVDWSISGQLGC